MSQVSNRETSLAALLGHIPPSFWTCLLSFGGGWCCLFFIPTVLNLPARIPGIIDGCPRMIDQNVLGVSTARGEHGLSWRALQNALSIQR